MGGCRFENSCAGLPCPRGETTVRDGLHDMSATTQQADREWRLQRIVPMRHRMFHLRSHACRDAEYPVSSASRSYGGARSPRLASPATLPQPRRAFSKRCHAGQVISPRSPPLRVAPFIFIKSLATRRTPAALEAGGSHFCLAPDRPPLHGTSARATPDSIAAQQCSHCDPRDSSCAASIEADSALRFHLTAPGRNPRCDIRLHFVASRFARAVCIDSTR